MKTLKSIGLFFVTGVLCVGLGFVSGVWYYGKTWVRQEDRFLSLGEEEGTLEMPKEHSTDPQVMGNLKQQEVASVSEELCADTEYVIRERDVLRGTGVETKSKLPQKYIGMDRERFITAMKTYESSPPLTELERGFVSAEVVSFSKQRVVVEMNYRYVQPGECFYLALLDHRVVVFLEDRKTIYINTGISANMLSEELRSEMMVNMIYMEDEKELYDFLEAYSS